MSIQEYDHPNVQILRDTAVYGANVYLDHHKNGHGQGCNTIWFDNVPAARAAFNRDGLKSGWDLFDCEKCGCHYSNTKPEYGKYPDHACSKAKKQYARLGHKKPA